MQQCELIDDFLVKKKLHLYEFMLTNNKGVEFKVWYIIPENHEPLNYHKEKIIDTFEFYMKEKWLKFKND